ncbi:hypothetical protein BASA50_000971 [Batrachochytrium salamandrivorans]|uniref:Uncharacterized protein n=1 Tax=Batrachochytrium salamandrivorans TaxID=1357716 RepID=A0ABQ8ESB5_9FUNG|nr:hypothetical protein BASA62_002943 [Batrachochytrium salamandrivorans]KAH6583199.1 hypothetical protein BASA60_001577 [Batrachochytrium salamandrivorans]KAH6585810.1 hypothetical protein BASA50_000971 [Batrachochytrium salamandrivorans]KAH6591529.1 hypothetical protein BASA61_004906 [Batrachochytrium salamandrivorans]KAH9269431.1 hypothetical protein BASA83_008514 [Batrachochytrium salamandrivorans]
MSCGALNSSLSMCDPFSSSICLDNQQVHQQPLLHQQQLLLLQQQQSLLSLKLAAPVSQKPFSIYQTAQRLRKRIQFAALKVTYGWEGLSLHKIRDILEHAEIEARLSYAAPSVATAVIQSYDAGAASAAAAYGLSQENGYSSHQHDHQYAQAYDQEYSQGMNYKLDSSFLSCPSSHLFTSQTTSATLPLHVVAYAGGSAPAPGNISLQSTASNLPLALTTSFGLLPSSQIYETAIPTTASMAMPDAISIEGSNIIGSTGEKVLQPDSQPPVITLTRLAKRGSVDSLRDAVARIRMHRTSSPPLSENSMSLLSQPPSGSEATTGTSAADTTAPLQPLLLGHERSARGIRNLSITNLQRLRSVVSSLEPGPLSAGSFCGSPNSYSSFNFHAPQTLVSAQSSMPTGGISQIPRGATHGHLIGATSSIPNPQLCGNASNNDTLASNLVEQPGSIPVDPVPSEGGSGGPSAAHLSPFCSNVHTVQPFHLSQPSLRASPPSVVASLSLNGSGVASAGSDRLSMIAEHPSTLSSLAQGDEAFAFLQLQQQERQQQVHHTDGLQHLYSTSTVKSPTYSHTTAYHSIQQQQRQQQQSIQQQQQSIQQQQQSIQQQQQSIKQQQQQLAETLSMSPLESTLRFQRSFSMPNLDRQEEEHSALATSFALPHSSISSSTDPTKTARNRIPIVFDANRQSNNSMSALAPQIPQGMSQSQSQSHSSIPMFSVFESWPIGNVTDLPSSTSTTPPSARTVHRGIMAPPSHEQWSQQTVKPSIPHQPYPLQSLNSPHTSPLQYLSSHTTAVFNPSHNSDHGFHCLSSSTPHLALTDSINLERSSSQVQAALQKGMQLSIYDQHTPQIQDMEVLPASDSAGQISYDTSGYRAADPFHPISRASPPEWPMFQMLPSHSSSGNGSFPSLDTGARHSPSIPLTPSQPHYSAYPSQTHSRVASQASSSHRRDRSRLDTVSGVGSLDAWFDLSGGEASHSRGESCSRGSEGDPSTVALAIYPSSMDTDWQQTPCLLTPTENANARLAYEETPLEMFRGL